MPPAMHYELYMRAALAEAPPAAAAGERADGAVAVLDEAMVASGRTTGAASPATRRRMRSWAPSARRRGGSGAPSLAGVTVFVVVEPCAMCVGRAARRAMSTASSSRCPTRSTVPAARPSSWRSGVDGARTAPASCRASSQADAAELRPAATTVGLASAERPTAPPDGPTLTRGRAAAPSRRRPERAPLLSSARGEVSEWLMVPLSKSGVRKHRGFESHPLRHSPPLPGRGSPTRGEVA